MFRHEMRGKYIPKQGEGYEMLEFGKVGCPLQRMSAIPVLKRPTSQLNASLKYLASSSLWLNTLTSALLALSMTASVGSRVFPVLSGGISFVSWAFAGARTHSARRTPATTACQIRGR